MLQDVVVVLVVANVVSVVKVVVIVVLVVVIVVVIVLLLLLLFLLLLLWLLLLWRLQLGFTETEWKGKSRSKAHKKQKFFDGPSTSVRGQKPTHNGLFPGRRV